MTYEEQARAIQIKLVSDALHMYLRAGGDLKTLMDVHLVEARNSLNVTVLELRPRTLYCLTDNGIATIGDLLRAGRSGVLSLPGVRYQRLNEITSAMNQIGIFF